MRIFCAVALLVTAACSSNRVREDCTNGKDDDGNGQIDCNDVDCQGTPVCIEDAGFWGGCAKCGLRCTRQTECLSKNVLDERPLPLCGSAGKCQELNTVVQVRLQYDTMSWGGVSSSILGAITTRWISKTGLDGGVVSCASVIAASSVTTSSAVETNGGFTVYGFDSTKYMPSGASVSNPLIIPYAYTASSSDYVIFSEAWTGGIDSTTRLPNGTRKGKGCIESGPEVAPITTADDCSTDAGSCRTLHLTLPPPCQVPDAGTC